MSAVRVGAGAAVLLGVMVLVVALGGSVLGRVVEFDSTTGRVFRFAIGVVLIVFGLRQGGVVPVRMRWLNRVANASSHLMDPAKIRNQAGRDLTYGFAYLLAGFG